MAGNYKKEDLRVIKTQKAFHRAIELLLQRRKFKHITINELCEEALTSRAAFYTHYKDKYDLLESWFCDLVAELTDTGIDNIVKRIIYSDTKIMQNIMYEADDETIGIVHSFVCSMLDSSDKIPANRRSKFEYTILSNFYVGGLFEMVKWQNKQKNPQEFQSAQNYIINLTKAILDFHIKYDN